MLEGKTVAEQVYRRLFEEYNNHIGVSSLMGAMYVNSGLSSTIVDFKLKKKLKAINFDYCTDQAYTDAVDEGIVAREEFAKSSIGGLYGYGLMHWKSVSQKLELYDTAHNNDKSVGDLETQLDFLTYDIAKNYHIVQNAIANAKSIRTCSDVILVRYEDADITDKEQDARLAASEKYFKEFSSVVKKVTRTTNKPAVFEIGDRVLVNGPIFGFGDGSGSRVEKHDAVMYVTSMVNAERYPYYIGVARTEGGVRQGWTNPKHIAKIRTTGIVTTGQRIAQAEPESCLLMLKGQYSTQYRVYLRAGAGSHKPAFTDLPAGHLVTADGRYTAYKGVKWLYVNTTYKGISYDGFCCMDYLIKV